MSAPRAELSRKVTRVRSSTSFVFASIRGAMSRLKAAMFAEISSAPGKATMPTSPTALIDIAITSLMSRRLKNLGSCALARFSAQRSCRVYHQLWATALAKPLDGPPQAPRWTAPIASPKRETM